MAGSEFRPDWRDGCDNIGSELKWAVSSVGQSAKVRGWFHRSRTGEVDGSIPSPPHFFKIVLHFNHTVL